MRYWIDKFIERFEPLKAVFRRGALPKRNPASSSAQIRAELLERVGRRVGGGVEGGGRWSLGPGMQAHHTGDLLAELDAIKYSYSRRNPWFTNCLLGCWVRVGLRISCTTIEKWPKSRIPTLWGVRLATRFGLHWFNGCTFFNCGNFRSWDNNNIATPATQHHHLRKV